MGKYVFSRIFRLPLETLVVKTEPNSVHRVEVQERDVPACVRKLLSKSIKFIPQCKPDHIQHLCRQVHEQARRLAWYRFFGASKCQHLSSPSVWSRASLPSGSWPKLDADQISKLAIFKRTFVDGIIDSYSKAQSLTDGYNNFSKVDRAGLAWLRANARRVLAIEADKNLGVVIADTQWVQQQNVGNLRCYVPISSDE